MNDFTKEDNRFKEIKESIELALEEIKNKSPELYEHLKKSIVTNEKDKTFGYFPDDDN